MNGGVIGKKNILTSGIWLVDDVLLSTNGIQTGVPKDAVIYETFESSSGITVYQAVVSTNTTNFKSGSAAVNLYKTQTSYTYFESYKTGMPSADFTGKTLGVLIYIKEQVVLDKLASIGWLWGQSTTKRFGKSIEASTLGLGWNKIEFSVDSFGVNSGTPTKTGVVFWDFTGNAKDKTYTFSAGDIVLDAFYYR